MRGNRVKDVDTRVTGTDPDAAQVIDDQCAEYIAGKRFGMRRVVPVHRESIGAAVPPGQATVREGDPEVVVNVFGDRLDEVARKPVGRPAAVTVAKEPVSVVANEAVLGSGPHESLAVLQGGVDGALGQAAGGRQMREDGRGCIGAARGRCGGQGPQTAEQDAQLDCDPDYDRAHTSTLRESVVPDGDRIPRGSSSRPQI